MKTGLFSNILLVTMTMTLTVPAFAQSGDEENIINAGSGINQLSENIQSLLEPVGGGGEGLIGPGDPGDALGVETGGDMDDGDGVVPIDGGLSLLLAAGAAYGARRVRRRSGSL